MYFSPLIQMVTFLLTSSQGAGEAIRGNINAAIDSSTGDRESAARQEAIATKGANEMDQGYTRHHNTGPGVAQTGAGSTNYGPHDTNTGNKLDPRYDSDLDNRGPAGGSSNFGPHSTNIGNKADPRVDSDLSGRHR
jgi:hypothetical protein